MILKHCATCGSETMHFMKGGDLICAGHGGSSIGTPGFTHQMRRLQSGEITYREFKQLTERVA